MPIRKITSLPQGTFIGKVAVDNDSPVRQPFFCGAVQIDLEEYARKERDARDIPDLTDFELDGLWNQISSPEIGRIYIRDHLMEQVRSERKRGRLPALPEEDVQEEADRRFARMTDADCERMLRGMLPELKEKEIARVIEENFYAIRADIRQLIDLECQSAEDEGMTDGAGGSMEQSIKPASEL